jgi:hypothetical protein
VLQVFNVLIRRCILLTVGHLKVLELTAEEEKQLREKYGDDYLTALDQDGSADEDGIDGEDEEDTEVGQDDDEEIEAEDEAENEVEDQDMDEESLSDIDDSDNEEEGKRIGIVIYVAVKKKLIHRFRRR